MRLFLIFSFVCLSISLYAQRKPVPNLPAISPEEAGFNMDSINALDDTISNFPQGDYRGLMVIKDNQLVLEYYYNQFWRNHIHDIRSSGKSITALLLGVAIKEGLVQNIDQDVYSFFPKEKYPDMHKDYKKVKIKHLLDMVSGLDANSDDNQTPGHAGKWGDTQLADYNYMHRLLNEQSPAIGNYNSLADGYGMLWYRSKRTFGKKEVSYLWASGNGGNHLVIIPKKNMVIAMTSGAYAQRYQHSRAYFILGKVLNALEE